MMALGQYDWSLGARISLLFLFFKNTIRGQGTAHHYDLMDKVDNAEVFFSIIFKKICIFARICIP